MRNDETDHINSGDQIIQHQNLSDTVVEDDIEFESGYDLEKN